MILTKQNEIVQTHSRVPIRVGSTIQLHYEVSPNYSDLSRKYGQAPVVSNDRRNSEDGYNILNTLYVKDVGIMYIA